MRVFSFVVCFLICCSPVVALDTQSFQDQSLQTSYNSLQTRLDDRYKAIAPIASADLAKISRLESTLTSAYRRADSAKNAAAKKLANAGILTQTKLLDRLLTDLERAKNTGITPPIPNNVPVSSATEVPVTWGILYYADSFEWAGTAGGDSFHQAGFSAARCNIPIGTLMQVRYLDKAVLVKANDRPNCAKHPDIVDLTKAAFSSIAPISKGKLDGTLVALGSLPKWTVKEYVWTDAFADYGVTLDANTPNLFLPNETVHFAWTVNDGKWESLAYLVSPSGKNFTLGQQNAPGNRFEYFFPLSEIGQYKLVVASGHSFQWARPTIITVLDPAILQNKLYRSNPQASNNIHIGSERLESGDLTATELIRVDGLPEDTFRSVRITSLDSKSSVSRTGMSALAFDPTELAAFPAGTKVRLEVTARSSTTEYSIDTYSNSATVFSDEYLLAPDYKTERKENINVSAENGILSVRVGKWVTKKLRNHAYLITPSGSVEEVAFGEQFLWSDRTLATNDGANLTYTLHEDGAYVVEVLYDTGFAAYFGAVTKGKVLSVLPNLYDQTSKDISSDTATSTSRMLESVNALRKAQGLAEVTLDANLSKLALFKAQDMSDHDYVGHVDSAGGYILDTAKRASVTIATSIGENVAGGTVWADYLESGLLLSGAHRANMLAARWSKIGIGIVVRAGKVSVVQVFTP